VATTKQFFATFIPCTVKSPACLAGLFVLLLMLTGCQTAKTPDEVTAAFWEALIEDKLEIAKAYATPASRDLVKKEPNLENASVETGQIVINDPAASVETIITLTTNEEAGKTLSFNTVLAKEHDQWLVDYRQTLLNISSQPLNGIIRSLKSLGDIFNKQLEQQLPLIEKQIESFGQELKKQLDEFGRQLEKPSSPDKQSPHPGTI
jgi:hypothetical protein